MKRCIFGSSFNPPHLAHQQIVEALKQLNFDQVLIVPTGNPNYKQIEISTSHRIELVEAFAKLCDVEVSFHEIENQFGYTVESLDYMNFDQADEIYFAVGSDSVNSLPTWDYFDRLKAMVTFVVIKRPGVELDQQVLNQIKYINLEIETADISSSQLRTKLDRQFIPEPVYDLIRQYNLY